MKYCTKCGSQVSENDKFCSDCGRQLDNLQNDEPIKVEFVNTNTDKVVKVAKKIIAKNPKYLKWYIFIFCFLVIGFIPVIFP
tara:strand:- start:152 stop:397 length:246 start_codon:yes stop_codon:yes gene_type:complete